MPQLPHRRLDHWKPFQQRPPDGRRRKPPARLQYLMERGLPGQMVRPCDRPLGHRYRRPDFRNLDRLLSEMLADVRLRLADWPY